MKKSLLILLLVTAISFAQNNNYKQRDSFPELLNKNDKVIDSLSILQKGKPVYNKSEGYKYINENDSRLTSTDTINRIELTKKEIKQYEGIYECKGMPFNLVFEANGKTLKGGTDNSRLLVLSATQKIEFTTEEASGVVLSFDLKNKTVVFKSMGHTPKTFTKKQ